MIRVVHPGSMGQNGTGSRIRIRNTAYSSTGTVPLYRRREREPPGLLASSPPQCKTSSLFRPRTSQENSFVLLFLSSLFICLAFGGTFRIARMAQESLVVFSRIFVFLPSFFDSIRLHNC